ncbi:hypothetical protein QJS66_05205 [Kocuria rhizophila]|nr:hypothetical protein QJS66_05205 [Kocuria rhizophila]
MRTAFEAAVPSSPGRLYCYAWGVVPVRGGRHAAQDVLRAAAMSGRWSVQ